MPDALVNVTTKNENNGQSIGKFPVLHNWTVGFFTEPGNTVTVNFTESPFAASGGLNFEVTGAATSSTTFTVTQTGGLYPFTVKENGTSNERSGDIDIKG